MDTVLGVPLTKFNTYMENEARKQEPGNWWLETNAWINGRPVFYTAFGISILIAISVFATLYDSIWRILYLGVFFGAIGVSFLAMVANSFTEQRAKTSLRWVPLSPNEFRQEYMGEWHTVSKRIIELRKEDPAREFEVQVLRSEKTSIGKGFVLFELLDDSKNPVLYLDRFGVPTPLLVA
jgi:hypothetical protein